MTLSSNLQVAESFVFPKLNIAGLCAAPDPLVFCLEFTDSFHFIPEKITSLTFKCEALLINMV